MKKLFIVILICAVAISVGCNGLTPPSELVRAPHSGAVEISDDEITSIAKLHIPDGATFATPRYPEGSKAVQSVDIDGDGYLEILATYITNGDPITAEGILLKKVNDSWTKIWHRSMLGIGIDWAGFRNIAYSDVPELIFGVIHSESIDKTLECYTWRNNKWEKFVEFPYSRLELEEFDNSPENRAEMVIWQQHDETELYPRPPVDIVHFVNIEGQTLLRRYEAAVKNYAVKLIGTYKKHINENPTESTLWYVLANLQLESGLYEDALASMEEAGKLDESYLERWNFQLQRGNLLFLLDKHEDALKAYYSAYQSDFGQYQYPNSEFFKILLVVNSTEQISKIHEERADYKKAAQYYVNGLKTIKNTQIIDRFLDESSGKYGLYFVPYAAIDKYNIKDKIKHWESELKRLKLLIE